jgi:hypothetical protein
MNRSASCGHLLAIQGLAIPTQFLGERLGASMFALASMLSGLQEPERSMIFPTCLLMAKSPAKREIPWISGQ